MASSSSSATPIELGLPVNCTIGGTCLIQKLVDHDPSRSRLDYHCGDLTTDGHDGIDFRLRTMAAMTEGIAVVAAADGVVLRIRDGEPDVSVRIRKDLDGRDAGNAVVIDHGSGWITQYSHLRVGTVRVKPGQRIRAGEQIGLVGMSGNAEFPHLHFALRFEGRPVDPFTGPFKPGDCKNNDTIAGSLWTRNAARVLGYQPSAVIEVGLAASVPPALVADRPGRIVAPGRSHPLILWADVIGAKAGDTQRFRILGPTGRVVHEQSRLLDRGGLSWFAYSGLRAPPGSWPPGRYSGEYELARAGAIVAQGASDVIIQ